MAVSEVDISNRALQLLGAKAISSLNDDSVSARACKLCYEPIKKALLEMYEWSFAIKRAQLAADATPPDWGKANSFTLPADFLNLGEPYPEDNDRERDWEIEDGKILTNDSAPLNIRYIYDVTDPNKMPFLFQEALAASMAMQMAEQLTQSNPKKQVVMALVKETLAQARRSNAMRKISKKFPEDDFITRRM